MLQTLRRVYTQSERATNAIGSYKPAKDTRRKDHPLTTAGHCTDLACVTRVIPEDFIPRDVEVKNIVHQRNP